MLAGATLGPLGLLLHLQKAQIVCVRKGKQLLDFLGFHDRMVESRQRRGRYWMQKWPSPRAMASIRAKFRDVTAPRQVGRRWTWWWKNSTPSCGAKFGAVDSYVHNGWPFWPAGNTAARGSTGQTATWARLGNLGIHRLEGTVRYPAAHCLTVNGVGKPWAGEPHARFDGGPLGRKRI